MDKLDEGSLRRPEFRGDVPIVLDDGQTWYLPKPRLRWRLAPASEGPRRMVGTIDAQGEYQAALDALDACMTAESEDAGIRYVEAKLGLAHAVIRLNYQLDDVQVSGLVSWSADDQEDATLEKVLEVAQGIGPKLTRGGDADA